LFCGAKCDCLCRSRGFSSLFCGAKCDCLCRSRGFSSLFCGAKCDCLCRSRGFSSLFCGAKCDCLCRSRGFSSLFCGAKCLLCLHSMCLLQEQRIFLLVFAKQKSESSDEERIFLLNKNAQRWLFSSAPLYADNTLAHHIAKCKYYVIHFVLSYYFSVNIMGE